MQNRNDIEGAAERPGPGEWSWDDLRLYLAALRAGSLTGAAKALGINQSTASRRLAALETALGARLFDRLREGLEPTPAALDVRPLAEAAEAAMLGFAQAVGGRDEALAGAVRVSVPDAMDSLLVVPELPAFFERYPRIALEVVGTASLANLARREADLALRLMRPAGGELVARRLALLTTGIWSRPEAPDVFIAGDEGEGSPVEAAWLAAQVPSERVRLRVNRMEARVAAVRAGLGRAVLPDSAAAHLGGLVRHAGEPPSAELWLLAHRRLYPVPRVRAVWDFLVQAVGARLSGTPRAG